MKALLPGSYDPLTIGHFDLALRAADLFGEVVIAVLSNGEKNGFFSPEERAQIIAAAIGKRGDPRLSVTVSDGLLAGLYTEIGADCMVKGIRNASDYVYENELWLINRSFEEKCETVFLPAKAEYAHLSSTMVREMLKYGLPLDSVLPEGAAETATTIYRNKKGTK